MKNKEISLVFNTTEGRESITDSASIRRTALDQKICSSTTIEGARAICRVIENQVDWRVKKLQDIKKMLDEGLITEAEFKKLKEEILN